MTRDVDLRKKRKALRKLRKAAELAAQGLGPPLSDWEQQFLEEVEARIETYGSAFADPEKGGRDEALSALQAQKLREIDRKARGKSPTGFQRRRPPRLRDEQRQESTSSEAPPDIRPGQAGPVPVPDTQDGKSPRPSATTPHKRPQLRLVKTDREAD